MLGVDHGYPERGGGEISLQEFFLSSKLCRNFFSEQKLSRNFFLKGFIHTFFLCLSIEKKWRQCSQATILARIFRIEQSYQNLIYYKKYVSLQKVSVSQMVQSINTRNTWTFFLGWKLVNPRTVNVLFFHSISYFKKNFCCTPITVLVCLILMIVYAYAGSLLAFWIYRVEQSGHAPGPRK